MTMPRLYFGAASDYSHNAFFRSLLKVSTKTAVPWGSIFFTAFASVAAILFFQSFGRVVNFIVVAMQMNSILLVGSALRLKAGTQVAGYPWTPLCFVIPMAMLLLSAIYFNPADTLKGIALTATSIPVYFWLSRNRSSP